ncbi:MAG: hypothetical protein HC933_19375, partial [Pleurocapsa sp. SU_196_0]|nr:hypothetical protein [Pleurocapsa sp. SU_196_0]
LWPAPSPASPTPTSNRALARPRTRSTQRPALRDHLETLGFNARLEADLTGRERFVIARKRD